MMQTQSTDSAEPVHLRKYLNCQEAANYLGASLEFLAQCRCRGEGPRYIRAGRGKRMVRYNRGDLDAYMVARTVETTARRA